MGSSMFNRFAGIFGPPWVKYIRTDFTLGVVICQHYRKVGHGGGFLLDFMIHIAEGTSEQDVPFDKAQDKLLVRSFLLFEGLRLAGIG